MSTPPPSNPITIPDGSAPPEDPHQNPSSPSSPPALTTFDWDAFEARCEQALADADREEQAILESFEELSRYFSIWAATSSVVDNERATKRLQTRERFVTLAEKRTAEKQEHHERVLRAFRSALALLRQ